ncbi:hypothetical protein F5Y00DRAFT_269957 [Daldinia vernicosa]|uniref:uncharacterized protein n=1 Tax=Daldinia vernicosa TaxID=114800 RepID=UPI0020085F47|nr:uncharacterized protein F5Y00DRAFT_269957 [Daldinia vernicosa]KAI0848724.1 hypothetical protein F5Y00DRAFT_269957 [Daldinia vernicosa]
MMRKIPPSDDADAASTQTPNFDQLPEQLEQEIPQRARPNAHILHRKFIDFKKKLSRCQCPLSDSPPPESSVQKPCVAVPGKSETGGSDSHSYNSQRNLSSIGLTESKYGSIGDSRKSYSPTWYDCETDELAKAVPQPPIFRKWPDEELQLQREVIEKYEAGIRLWTKKKLLDMEDTITGFVPDVVRTSLYAGPGFYIGRKEIGHLYQIDFHGYYDMAFPFASRPEGAPYSSMTIKVKPAYTYIRKNIDEEEKKFVQCQAA